MKHLIVIIALLPVAAVLLISPGCRDRDDLLSPMGPVGYLKLSVDFAPEEKSPAGEHPIPAAAGISAGADKRKAVSQSSSPVLSAAITRMDAEVYDGSQGALVSLAADRLNINWSDSSFSGTLTVEAGSARVVAVRAYTTGEGVIYLGVEPGIEVKAGQVVEARITMNPYVPVLSLYDQISQTGDITLDWILVANATGYIVQESTTADFATYDSLVVGESSASLSGRPGGTRYFRILARGNFAVSSPSDIVSVRVAAAPVLTILSPPGGGVAVQLGEPVLFLVQVLDEFQDLITEESIAWKSSRDGFFANGSFAFYSMLSLGDHLITVIAPGVYGSLSSDTVGLSVVASGNLAPEVNLDYPADGGSFNRGETILFLASGTDPEDGELPPENFYWLSSRDRYFGGGGALEYDGLSIGEHTVLAVGTDASGAAGADSISLSIVSSGANTAPQARIVTPAAGSVFPPGAPVLIQGLAEDAEEGLLSGEALAWSSSADGALGTGAVLVAGNLSLGSHTLFLTAVDAQGAADQESVAISVADGAAPAPTATITLPPDGSTFQVGTSILFIAAGEGAIEEFVWFSTPTGVLGTGQRLESSVLPLGTNTVYLAAVDSRGAAGLDSVQITVNGGTGNQAPVANIVFPEDGLSFAVGTPILFAGTAADAEEGNLPGERLKWYSSISGLVGSGDYLVRSDLPEGEHQVILLATDAQGLTGYAEVSIRLETGGNQSPAAVITSPQTGAVFPLGTSVSFTGTASDQEDGVLDGSALTWISSIDEMLGTGANLVTDQLSAGRHTIVLLARDSQGAGAFDTISISLSYPPEAEIISPVDGSSYPFSAPIEFNGSARDPEEGVLPGSALLWISSLEEEPIGIGASFVSRALRLGTHQITLIAGDRLGLADSATVTIEVVAIPDSLISMVSVGAAPLRVTVDPVAAAAYLTNSGDNSLSVVELQNFTETDRIGVGNNPIGLAISQYLGRIYVANTSGDNLSVVEGGSVVQTIPVGYQPMGVALNHDESLVFVSNSNAASISVISTTEGKVVHTIESVGNSPGNLLIPPGSNLLFVSNYGSRDISDTSEDEVAAINLLDYTISRIPVGDKPLGLASTSDGSLVFVANSGSNSVSIIRTAGLEVINDVAVGMTPTACALTPDDNQLYVVNSASADISVIDISSKTVIEVIPEVGQQPYGIAVYNDPAASRVLALVTDRAWNRLIVLLVL